MECQSYDDGSMAIRIAEYAFIVARQFATLLLKKGEEISDGVGRRVSPVSICL